MARGTSDRRPPAGVPAGGQDGRVAGLWGDGCGVDVLVQPAGEIEAGAQRRGAGATGLRVAGDIGAVVVTAGGGCSDGVPLVGPDPPDRVAPGGPAASVAEARNPP